MSLQLRVEALNATNTPHFSNPATNVANLQLNPDGTVRNLNGFGVITSTNRLGRQYDEREYGEEFQRVTLDGEQRSGVLTQGAILTVSSYPTRTSPCAAKWVLENLLGTPPPPPPDDVPSLNESNIGTEVSLRERLEQHRKDPSCSPCHVLMDPLGFGLENYDAVGAWRTHDGKFPIETTGTLPGGQTFTGSKGLKEILRGKSEAFVHNVTEKLLTYSLGRGLERFDRPTVEMISRRVAANNYRFSALVMEVVKSKPFQMQSVEGARP